MTSPRGALSWAVAAGLLTLVVCSSRSSGAEHDLLWAADGVTVGNDGESFQHISDGAGGAIIAFAKVWALPSSTGPVYAVRLDGTGNILWGPVLLSGVGAPHGLARLCSDGCGGALVAWTKQISSGVLQIQVQRISGSGVMQWAIPVAASAQFADVTPALAVAAGYQSMFLVYRSDLSLYAGQISIDGVLSSPGTAGLALGTTSVEPCVVRDGSGGYGVIVAWSDVAMNTVVQRVVASTGTISAAWGSGSPVTICGTAGSDHFTPSAAADGSGGALIAWSEVTQPPPWWIDEIRVQKVDSSGSAQWAANGVVLVESLHGSGLAVASDGAGGAYVAWEDLRNAGLINNDDIFAQHLNASGVAQWASGGINVSPADNLTASQRRPKMVSDLAGGALVTFQDFRSTTYDIGLVKLTLAGYAWFQSVVGDSSWPSPKHQSTPAVIHDASGLAPKGCIVVWTDMEHWKVAAQKVALDWIPTPTFGTLNPNASPLTLSLQWQGSGYALEEATSIPSWAASDATVSVVGDSCTATDSSIGSIRFYRLRDDSKGFPVYGDPVGYIGLAMPGGWSAIGNPFQRLPGASTLNGLFKLHDQFVWSVVFKWDPPTSAWIWSVYLGAAFGWYPNLELPLGEGAVFGTAGGLPATVHLAGPLALGNPVIHSPAGFSIVAPPWPISQDLANLSYPTADFDWVFRFDNATGQYLGYLCFGGCWWPWGFPPGPVPLNLCESFWSWRGAPVDWVAVCPTSLP